MSGEPPETAPPASAPPLVPVLPQQVPCPGLEVRCWSPEDAGALAAAIAANIEHLRPYMPWIAQEPLDPQRRVEMIAQWEVDRRSGGGTVYGILRDGVILGGTGLHRRIAPDGVEIGYWLTHAEQGRGTVTRVVQALTATALAHPMITHVEIHMDAGNQRSAAVPARCGYRLVSQEERPVQAPAETGLFQVWRIP